MRSRCLFSHLFSGKPDQVKSHGRWKCVAVDFLIPTRAASALYHLENFPLRRCLLRLIVCLRFPSLLARLYCLVLDTVRFSRVSRRVVENGVV